jgi:hypothetical protein
MSPTVQALSEAVVLRVANPLTTAAFSSNGLPSVALATVSLSDEQPVSSSADISSMSADIHPLMMKLIRFIVFKLILLLTNF